MSPVWIMTLALAAPPYEGTLPVGPETGPAVVLPATIHTARGLGLRSREPPGSAHRFSWSRKYQISIDGIGGMVVRDGLGKGSPGPGTGI